MPDAPEQNEKFHGNPCLGFALTRNMNNIRLQIVKKMYIGKHQIALADAYIPIHASFDSTCVVDSSFGIDANSMDAIAQETDSRKRRSATDCSGETGHASTII